MDLRSFAAAIRELAEEKGVPEAKVIETIELAIAAAYKKDYGKKGQIIRAMFNPETGSLHFSQIKIVVDETMIKSEEEVAREETLRAVGPTGGEEAGLRRKGKEDEETPSAVGEGEIRKVRFNPERHIMLEEARETRADVAPGEELEFPLAAQHEFGRIASQTAKQVIIQRIREAEREATYAEYKDKEGGIVSGIVQRIEGRNVFVDLGRGVGILSAEEQIPREHLAIGERVKSLLLLVEKDSRGPGIFLSRSHPRFLARLFELEVPEVTAGLVEMKAIAREPGSRSKVAVVSNDPAVDPVGSMVGQRGVRVTTVINEIRGEKIDIIEWAADQAHFVSNALSPAKITDVTLQPESRRAIANVPEEQLSLAIGRGGQNVRLAAKLTGWRIDIRPAGAEATLAAATPEGTLTEATPATAGQELTPVGKTPAPSQEETPAPPEAVSPGEEPGPAGQTGTSAATPEAQAEEKPGPKKRTRKPRAPKSKKGAPAEAPSPEAPSPSEYTPSQQSVVNNSFSA